MEFPFAEGASDQEGFAQDFHLVKAMRALIIASATLNGLGKGLISRWLREPVDLSALPEGNKIFGVADDVIEAAMSVKIRQRIHVSRSKPDRNLLACCSVATQPGE